MDVAVAAAFRGGGGGRRVATAGMVEQWMAGGAGDSAGVTRRWRCDGMHGRMGGGEGG